MSVNAPNPEKMFWIDVNQFDIISMLFFSFCMFYFNFAAILEICKLGSEDAIFQLANNDFYPHVFFKKRGGYCNRLRPSVRPPVRPSVRLSVMLSPPKPLDKIPPNLVCELHT